jgi:hypothetical protein
MDHNVLNALCNPVEGAGNFFHDSPSASASRPHDYESPNNIARETSEAGSAERLRARIMCHSSSDPQRLVLVACILDIIWIHDGSTLEVPSCLPKLTKSQMSCKESTTPWSVDSACSLASIDLATL